MPPTAKVKLLRVLSLLQCCIAVFLVVLGIVERVHARWRYTGLGMPLWIGIWVGITGCLGVFISSKRVQNMSHGSFIPQHLVMTFMGFSLTCGVLSALPLYAYSRGLSTARTSEEKFYFRSRDEDVSVVAESFPVKVDAKHSKEHALVGSIYGFMVVEMIIAMWSAAICHASDYHKTASDDHQCETVLIGSPSTQDQGGNNVVPAVPVTAKIKLLRILSLIHCFIAVWFVVLGIVERVRVTWTFSGIAMPIWVGIWVGITGAFGVFISFKRVQNTSHGSLILEHLVMTFMGFSLSCGIMSTLVLFNYSFDLGFASTKLLRYRSFGSATYDDITHVFVPIKFDTKYSEEHGLVGSIFAFAVLELITAMWSVTICFVKDRLKSSEDEPCETPLMLTPTSRGQEGKSVASRFGYSAANA